MALKELFSEFEKRTGIKVKWEPALADFPSYARIVGTKSGGGIALETR